MIPLYFTCALTLLGLVIAMLVTRKMDRDEQKRWDEYEARAVERHREYMAMLDAVFNQERR
jgi:hypothetical protein